MKKTTYLIALLFLLAAASEASAQEKIRVGQGSISLQSGLMYIGKDRGLFAKYGLTTEVIYIPGGTTNVQVLLSGNLDLSQLSGAPGVAANLEGADIIYIASLLDKLNYQLVTRPEIKSVEQLKGKKFGVSRFGSSADFGLRAVFRDQIGKYRRYRCQRSLRDGGGKIKTQRRRRFREDGYSLPEHRHPGE